MVPMPVKVRVMPETNLTLPPEASPAFNTEVVAANLSVLVNPVQSRLRQLTVVEAGMVQVPVEDELKKTLVTAVGTDDPPVPPEVGAHLVLAVPSQLAVPPTQYRAKAVKIQPVLLWPEAPVELAPANQLAPPVAVES